MTRRLVFPALIAMICLAVPPLARAVDPPAHPEKQVVDEKASKKNGAAEKARKATRESDDARDFRFLRLRRDDENSPVALEVAIVRYLPRDGAKSGPTVDLIGAIHVAEPTYYDRLNEQFTRYDAVLYELVAPEGTRIPQGKSPRIGNPISFLQVTMTQLLDLEYQLQGIDYSRENLVHADMSPGQFAKSMQRRGESLFQTFLRMAGYAMAQQADEPAGVSDIRLLAAFLDKNRPLALKRVMAEQFEDLEGSMDAIEGPDGSTLISERNKVALGVLREQIDAGVRNLAVFYGAGHMPDFDKRLRDDFGLVPSRTNWLVAWRLEEPPKGNKRPAGKRPAKE